MLVGLVAAVVAVTVLLEIAAVVLSQSPYDSLSVSLARSVVVLLPLFPLLPPLLLLLLLLLLLQLLQPFHGACLSYTLWQQALP